MPIKDRAETNNRYVWGQPRNPMKMREIKIRLWYMSDEREIEIEMTQIDILDEMFDAPPDQPRIVARDL
jgi:hypothetical protein